MSFANLGLSEALLRAVADKGYSRPTPIQVQAIPAVLAGGDLLAGAQTGTGKTAGFVLPLLQRLMSHSPAQRTGPRKPVRALILTPTRELAAQVESSVRAYGKHVPLTSAIAIGGVGMASQSARLRRGVDILVATPGRLLDHHGQRNVDLSQVEIAVLDEADRMLDMGFVRDIRRIFALLPKRRQNLLFSATFSDEIRELADTLLDRPAMIEVAPRNATIDVVDQVVHPVDRDRKRAMLSALIRRNDWRQVLVFMRTKHGADRLADQLVADGVRAQALHGNKSQNVRTRTLAEFKQGDLRVLVATDIAARGIDIEELPHVVNYELPNVPEDYVHRIGRTGRAGAGGQALSLVCIDEHVMLRNIEKLIRKPIRREPIEGFTPDPNARAQPILQRQPRVGQKNASGGANSRSNGRKSEQAHGRANVRAQAPRGGSRSSQPPHAAKGPRGNRPGGRSPRP
ncbi:MAG: DEAD/DEAH box helicase [Betaproteobacteria bacterium]